MVERKNNSENITISSTSAVAYRNFSMYCFDNTVKKTILNKKMWENNVNGQWYVKLKKLVN